MNKQQLISELAVILDAVEGGNKLKWQTIQAHNYSSIESGFINRDNSHLFRQYRNYVSANPEQLVADVAKHISQVDETVTVYDGELTIEEVKAALLAYRDPSEGIHVEWVERNTAYDHVVRIMAPNREKFDELRSRIYYLKKV